MELFRLFGTILIDNDQANQSIAKTDKQAQSSSNSMSSAFKKVGTALVTAFSIAKIKQFGEACIDAYNVQVEAETKLETVMKQRMKASDDSIQSIKDYASELQNLGVVGDEVQLSGAQQLATFLDTDDALKTLMPAMNNLAVQQNGVNVTSQNMVSIGNLMGKVMQGQTSALTKVGITFTDAQEKVLKYGNEQERASMLAQVITDNVGNMNEEMAKTDDGKIQQAKNTFGDLQEKIGGVISPLKADFYGVLGDIALKLQNDVIPAVENFAKWLGENKDKIEDVAIVLSPLIALFGAYKLIVSSGAIMLGVYNAVTTLATTVTTALSTAMAFLTSPIGLVVVAVTGLIAIFTLAYKNSETFRNIVNSAINAVKDTVQNAVSKISNFFTNLKTSITTTWTNIKTSVSNTISSMFTSIQTKFNAIKTTATNIFNAVKNAIQNPMETAKNYVKKVIDSIKGFFNFKITFPHIPLPHFTVNPKGWSVGDLLKGSIPKLGIDWYEKAYDNPMILNDATIFGYQNGKLLGGGEKQGGEVVSGKETLLNMIRETVENSKNVSDDILNNIYELLLIISKKLNRPIVLDNGVLVGYMIDDIDSGLGDIALLKERGVK